MTDSQIIFEAARLHFEEGLTQEEVAGRLKVSRPTAARYIAIARETGYVRIRVLEPKSHAFLHDLEVDLCDRFPALREAMLTPSRSETREQGGAAARRAVVDELAERAATRVDQLLSSHRRTRPPVVAVARGEMIDAVVRRIRPSRPLPELEVLPMLGYLRSREYPFDANRLAQELARVYAGNYEWIPAPAVVTADEAAVLRAMPLVAEPLRKLEEEADLVITSISCPYATRPDGTKEMREQTLLQSDRVSAAAIAELVERERVVGEICGSYFSAGGLAQLDGVTILGLPLERLQAKAAEPDVAVIGVAGADVDRLPAIEAALRLGLINTLVTDYLTAHRLLQRGRRSYEREEP